MKKILFVALVCFVLSTTEVDESKYGPSTNYKHQGATTSCTDLYVKDGDNWRSTDIPQGVSDCVDTLLWDETRNKYHDRCCYVRFQLEGLMYAGCVGLSEENYLDTTETIRRMENGDRAIWTQDAAGSKIYQLDCKSSYIKVLSVASILFALIL